MPPSQMLSQKSRSRMLACSAVCLLAASMAGCGNVPPPAPTVIFKPVKPEPIAAELKASVPDPKCPKASAEYDVPTLERRARCFERDSATVRARHDALAAAVAKREAE